MARRTSRSRWSRSNWRGSMRARRRAAWRATWRWRRFTSAAPPNKPRTTWRATRPAQPGEDRQPKRGAFCLTEPIPYVGVETGLLGGKVRVVEWPDGGEPMLQVDKRGRFITNMGFANFVTAAVDSDDERIKGSCMIVLEETDPGLFDRGTPTRKLVHQLSSTNDPVFSLTVPASRIVGGYTVREGRHRAQVQPWRGDRGGVPPHARDRRSDDRRQAAVGRGAGPALSADAIPRRRFDHAGIAALRPRPAAARGRRAPAGRHLGDGRGQRVARVLGRAAVRRARSAREAQGRGVRRAGHRRRRARRCAPWAEWPKTRWTT